jgi:prepilin signal peptidase PulO-like enzyme (type II secretory pathway)
MPMALAALILVGFALGKAADLLLPLSLRGAPARLIRCPACGRRAAPLDVIPLIEALNRGKCYCGARLNLRWLLLPLVVALLSVVAYLVFDDFAQALVAAVFISILAALTATDLERRLLPDRIILPAVALALALGWALPGGSLLDSLYGGALAIAIAALLIVASLPFGGGSFGMGDAKLILLLGVLLGPKGVIVAVLLAMIAAGLVAAVLLFTRLMKTGSYLPFGPFLATGGVLAILWQAEIWDALFD